MKKLITLFLIIICIAQISNSLFAQDSTFCKSYYIDDIGYNFLEYYNDNFTAYNVFETHDNKLCAQLVLQVCENWHSPVIWQSVFLIFDRQGNFESIHCNPDWVYAAELKTKKLIKAPGNNYYVFDDWQYKIYLLDENFATIENIPLYSNLENNYQIYVKGFEKVNDGYLIVGDVWQDGQRTSTRVIKKYDLNWTPIWEYNPTNNIYPAYPTQFLSYTQNGEYLIASTQDIIIISPNGVNISNYVYQNIVSIGFSQLLNINDNLCGLSYYNDLGTDTITKSIIKIENYVSYTDTLFTYQDYYSQWSPDNSFARSHFKTIDNSHYLLAETDSGDLKKYDQNMNLIYDLSFNLNSYVGYHIAQGTSPLIELTNGDLFTFALSRNYPDIESYKVHLYRISPDGHFTPNDNTVITPSVDYLSCYPNPVKNQFNVEIKNMNPNNLDLCIYNIKGQLVKKISNVSSKSNYNTDDLSSGIYLISLRKNNSVIQQKKVTIIK